MSEKYSVKQHMQESHQGAASHHEAMAQFEMDKCEQHTALAAAHEDADQPEMAKCHKSMAKLCKAAAGAHTAEAKRHSDMAKMATGITKSVMDQLAENRGFGIEHVSGIVPPAPRAVPRFGQPTEISKAMIDPELEKFVEIED